MRHAKGSVAVASPCSYSRTCVQVQGLRALEDGAEAVTAWLCRGDPTGRTHLPSGYVRESDLVAREALDPILSGVARSPHVAGMDADSRHLTGLGPFGAVRSVGNDLACASEKRRPGMAQRRRARGDVTARHPGARLLHRRLGSRHHGAASDDWRPAALRPDGQVDPQSPRRPPRQPESASKGRRIAHAVTPATAHTQLPGIPHGLGEIPGQ